ncbi:Hypothetical_protein [Hexamita inflata]|uniref:Hypothetical_protein n=1 Tax=Hexamita inflata TaxID=28002 RepID=A0AA86QSH4_9EUKA|nr:Hypothetical protein HINF_LOCUS44860 [Hexamita inflata]
MMLEGSKVTQLFVNRLILGIFHSRIFFTAQQVNLRIFAYELNIIQVKMSVDVSWHYRQSLCTISVRDCFDSSSTSLWSFQRINILRQYSAILFLTMQDNKTPTTDFAAQTTLQLESTKCSKTWCGIQYNLQPTQVLLQQ